MDLAERGRRLAETFDKPQARDIFILRQPNNRWSWDVFFGEFSHDAGGVTETLDAALHYVRFAVCGGS